MSINHLLIIEDNQQVLNSLKLLAQEKFKQVTGISFPDRMMEICQKEQIDVILLDMNFTGSMSSGQEGLNWLAMIREKHPDISVVLITAYGDIDIAVEALKLGAQDFITKPWDNNRLLDTLVSASKISQEKKSLTAKIAKDQSGSEALLAPPQIIGKSPVMKKLDEIINKIADTDANVLITGENGTGKELIARQIHLKSRRRQQAFIGVDAGAIPEALFESELFGHEKGAFTDAHEARKGKLVLADQGTFFLDEIANLPTGLQAKLLSALQNRMVYPLGASKAVKTDIRLITATNQDPVQLVSKGKFREDLLYRINTITIHVPALRDRGEDILILAKHFLDHYSKLYKRSALSLSPGACEALLHHRWSGNVRELQHCMERVVILADQETIGVEDLHLRHLGPDPGISLNLTLDEMEQKMIRAALDKTGGNMTEAARILGITRQTLYNKMKKK